MTDNRPTKGICRTCRYAKQRRYCEYGVVDRPRGGAAQIAPCGWWKARKR